LDAVVQKWAESFVGENSNEEGVWSRAAKACLHGSAGDIDIFFAKEWERATLRVFESFFDGDTRLVEMFGGALAVMIHDKTVLTEEDMLPARLLIFGRAKGAFVKQVGQRWFLA